MCFHDENDEGQEEEESGGHDAPAEDIQVEENEVNVHAIEDPGENQLDDLERNESQDMNQDGSVSSIQKRLKMEKKLSYHHNHETCNEQSLNASDDEEYQLPKIKKIFVQPFEQNLNETKDNAAPNVEVNDFSEQDNIEKKKDWKDAECSGYENQCFEMEKINTNEAHIGGSVHEKLDEYFTRPKVTAVQH